MNEDNESKVPIGIMTEDGHVLLYGTISGKPPFAGGLWATDAEIAIKTLPRIAQSMIYRYAKWKLKNTD